MRNHALESFEVRWMPDGTIERIRAEDVDRVKTLKSDKERGALDRLVRRAFAEGKCKWDARHASELLTLLAAPQNVGFVFRIRERIHRIFSKRSMQFRLSFAILATCIACC